MAEYISGLNDAPIFLFGDTGTGGLVAQYYAASSNYLSGFAQFGCAIYKDAAPLSISSGTLGIAYPVVRLFSKIAPGMKIKFKPPQYNGFHADKDNGFYEFASKQFPGFLDMTMSLVKTVLDILCAPDSPIQKGGQVPTLVFKTKHDRYFPQSYFDQYYNSLTCPKKLVEIDDVHNSYYFYPDLFASHVVEWFDSLLQRCSTTD